jgi:hypothetical protein
MIGSEDFGGLERAHGFSKLIDRSRIHNRKEKKRMKG